MKSFLILSLVYLAVFSIAELVYHFGKTKAEYTRKFVHISSGLIALSFPILFEEIIWVFLLCGSFLVILIASQRFSFLPSINNIGRKSLGGISYPIAVFGCFVFYHYQQTHNCIYFYLPIIILAICDPIAALVGRRFPIFSFKVGRETKSVAGSSAFFISAILICIFTMYLCNINFSLYLLILIASVATLIEAISRKGLDNMFIPASVILCLMI